MVNLDVREDNVVQDDKLNSLVGAKVKTLRLVSDGDFKLVQLDDNLARSIWIEANLPKLVRRSLIQCLITNTGLFVISLDEMLLGTKKS